MEIGIPLDGKNYSGNVTVIIHGVSKSARTESDAFKNIIGVCVATFHQALSDLAETTGKKHSIGDSRQTDDDGMVIEASATITFFHPVNKLTARSVVASFTNDVVDSVRTYVDHVSGQPMTAELQVLSLA